MTTYPDSTLIGENDRCVFSRTDCKTTLERVKAGMMRWLGAGNDREGSRSVVVLGEGALLLAELELERRREGG